MNFDAIKDYKVLIVGDAIYDRYVFVKPLGTAIKEITLSVSYEREETYKGGVWAGAAHLATLCAQVDILHGERVLTNTRFVEVAHNRKLLTLHEVKREVARFVPNIPDYDLAIVMDFGHGTMTPDLIAQVSQEARFLAVNVQTSSTNFGFNLITKYSRADFIVLDDIEARLAAHDRDSPIEDVILALGFRNIIVTQGRNGAVGFDGAFERQAALTDTVVDTMGAGDAFLCVTAPFAAAGCSMRELVRIGNAAGAIKVGILGHRQAVTKTRLLDFLKEAGK
jgi:bifunctional ADP-heptose synthase (sugar kinase/adenylyltransferase)